MGLVLLGLRVGVYESGMFNQLKQSAVKRGNFGIIFRNPKRALKYICGIAIGMPIWYVIGILVTYSPEFAKAHSMPTLPNPARAVMFLYLGCALGDFLSGGLSQYFKNRKKVVLGFLLATSFLIALYLTTPRTSLIYLYTLCFALGLATGYWAVFVTMASEQFGTNIRATVTTTTPNFVRGALVPLNFAFQAARASWGILWGAGIVGAVSVLIAVLGLSGLDETFGKNLDYCEDEK